MARARLTKRRLLGLDRSGPPPPETLAGAPLRPFTLPNAIGFVRIALIPVFLLIAFDSGDGRIASATVIYAVVAWSDYADGMLARLTGQYSRLGTLLDPLTDRLLVLAGAAVCWHFELLPRWALAVLAGRELLMLVLTRIWISRGRELSVSMLGRWAVWPTMSSFAVAITIETWVSDALLYLGLAMTLAATVGYLRAGMRAASAPSSST